MKGDRVARVAALVAAGLLGLIAAQLLLTGLEVSTPITPGQLGAAGDWIAERQREGALILVGVVLVLLGLWLAWSTVAGLRPPADAIVLRRRRGWTRVDCATLADSIERDLAPIDARSRIRVRVRPSGRVDVAVATPDPSAAGPAGEVRTALVALVADRRLPCKVGRVEVGPAHPKGPRVR